MKTRLELAHEYAMAYITESLKVDLDFDFNHQLISLDAFSYADAMLAENEKREQEAGKKKRAEMRELLNANNTFVEKEGQHFDDVEWQPDWSQAPDGYDWWAMDGFACSANWYKYEPRIDSESEDEDEWNIDIKAGVETYVKAPKFGYTGNWRDSLRKRPV